MSPAKENYSIEVTAEDAAAVASRSSFRMSSPQSASGQKSNASTTTSSVAKKFSKLIKPLRSPKIHKPSNSPTGSTSANNYNTVDDLSSRPYYAAADGDNSSFNGESIGQMSVAQTVASLDTVKISNRNALAMTAGGENNGDDGHSSKHKKTPWKKLKNFMTSNRKVDKEEDDDDDDNHHMFTASSSGAAAPHHRRAHSKSVDFVGHNTANSSTNNNNRRRTTSTDYPKSQSQASLKEQHQAMLREKALIDDAVRGRLDGMDLLYLGPAYQISLERQQPLPPTSCRNKVAAAAESSSTPWEPASTFSFAGRSTHYSTRQMVDDMMWRPTAGGQEAPEIVLEGFFRDDRWMVTLDTPRNGSTRTSSNGSTLAAIHEDDPNSVPLLQFTDEEEQSHSTTAPEDIPRHKLWGSMWGPDNKPPPKPSHMSSVEDIPSDNNILEMAASVSVPIDVDEDTFMISNWQHLQAVHDLAAVPLQHGRFDETLEIFQKILKGVEIQETDALRHLEGVTLHNMAVILMWQQKYEEALDCVGRAIKARLQYLPENHPDIAVSLARQGKCFFALERYSLAVASFQAASDIFKDRSVAQAKALSNLGVAKYQSGDDVEALNDFTNALEIQRMWLQGPVKREANVFGAAMILGNMGKVHIKRGDYNLAISVYEEALLVRF